MKKRILWVDDEIDLLKPHIILLAEKGYDVATVTNGEDAIAEVRTSNFDLIFLDEMMPGLGGLETLQRIKEIDPNIPVVMVTKSEEESLMNDAIGSKISDYLIKPIMPSQILMVCKKFLEKRRISTEYVAKDYLEDFSFISQRLMTASDYQDWIEIYLKLVNWDLESQTLKDIGLKQSLVDQKKEANREFSKFIENNYLDWINSPDDYGTPILSPQLLDKFVIPEVEDAEGPVFLFVLDCLRLDQWLVMEKHLREMFNIKKDYYYSILPTATPYARNAIFSGMFPYEIQQKYPELWQSGRDDENSQNKYEREFLQKHFETRRVKLRNELKYMKIIDPKVGRGFQQNVASHRNTNFMAVVVNFLDMIAHGRSDSELLKEIAPDEAAYLSLTNSWFEHSSLLETFKVIAEMKKAKVIVTTDHGSIRALRGAKVLGDKDASKSLRFKFGRNLRVDDKQAMLITDPPEYKLPNRGSTIGYIIAKEDYYFVYPTEYHKFLNYYKDTFQHGGISMEEMILPLVTMESKA